MQYSKRRKNLGGGRRKRSNRKSYVTRMSGGNPLSTEEAPKKASKARHAPPPSKQTSAEAALKIGLTVKKNNYDAPMPNSPWIEYLSSHSSRVRWAWMTHADFREGKLDYTPYSAEESGLIEQAYEQHSRGLDGFVINSIKPHLKIFFNGTPYVRDMVEYNNRSEEVTKILKRYVYSSRWG